MGLTIRNARPEDAGLVLDFIRELAVFEELEHEVVASRADVERDLFGAAPRVFCDIAEWAGEPVGFALWYYTFSTFQGRHGIWLEDLYVREAARGRGIGKALIGNLAQRCRAEGLGRLAWWVLNWNTPAIDFYTSQGAVMRDEWTVCTVMGKELEVLGA